MSIPSFIKISSGIQKVVSGNIQGVSKLNGKTLGMDSSYRETKKKGYDSVGPEMYGYRVVEACIY
jgi:hypothetical protein